MCNKNNVMNAIFTMIDIDKHGGDYIDQLSAVASMINESEYEIFSILMEDDYTVGKIMKYA